MFRRLKRLLPQRVKHLIYRLPLEHWKRFRSLGAGGYWMIDRWAAEMERSVETLPPLSCNETPVELWFLTGRRFWYQTAYCAWTFGRHSNRPVRLHLVDDGTLQPDHVAGLTRIFGPVEVLDSKASAAQLQSRLPSHRFPILNQRWNDYIHLRKLIDVHLGRTGPRLVLDSDMLFFDRPAALLDWLGRNGHRPAIYMTDCIESYGYSRPLMEALAAAPLPSKLNVGICGLNSEEIDWNQLESWSARLLAAEGTSYFLEQALVAMLAGRNPGIQVSADDYITLPTRHQIKSASGVLQHYVASSKADYFRHAWRIARTRCGA